MIHLKPIDSELFFSKKDEHDPRLGDLAQTHSVSSTASVIGYPDDEGVRINGGRTGAALGPTEIRRWLYKMTPDRQRPIASFKELGDLNCDPPLAERHEIARQTVRAELQVGRRVLALGGGNDYAYSDGAAFLDVHSSEKPLIINIDAHFDVRATTHGLSSGTPFYRLLEMSVFDFVELGIQSGCNSKHHEQYVRSKSGRILSCEDQMLSGKSWLEYTRTELSDWLRSDRPTFLAIDMDAFAWPYAAGTSASWPLGIQPQDFYSLYVHLLSHLNVRVVGLYEVSPSQPSAEGTAKLAAQWAHLFLHEF